MKVKDGELRMLSKGDAVNWCREHYAEAMSHPSPSVGVPFSVLMYKVTGDEAYLRDYRDKLQGALRSDRQARNFVHMVAEEYLDMRAHLNPDERRRCDDHFCRLALDGIEHGFFDNQITSLGSISALVRILREGDIPGDPERESVLDRLENLRERNSSWGGPQTCWRNGNDDNGIHLGLYMWSVYAWGQYCEPGYFASAAWRRFWDWMLRQWPPNGMTALNGDGHGHHRRYGDVDAFFMPQQSLRDGRLKWLADRVFRYWDARRESLGPRTVSADGLFAGTNIYRIWKRIDDDLEPREPDTGSVCIYSPGTERSGMMALSPRTLDRPDKVIFRDGWTNDALYAMLDLRGMTSHDHNDLNGITTVCYGEPFVVETKRYSPNRLYHNALMVAEGVKEDLFATEDGIPPSGCYADVDFFQDLPRATMSRTSNRFGRPGPVVFDHHRSCIFVKRGYLAVFDTAVSHQNRSYTLGANWHLVGERDDGDGYIGFSRKERRLDFFTPQSGQHELVERPSQWSLSNNAEDITRWWGFDSHIYDSQGKLADVDPPIHHLQLVSRDDFLPGEGWGALTIFHPRREKAPAQVSSIDVHGEDGASAYPYALAAEIKGENHDLIGCATQERTDIFAHEDRGLLGYGRLDTDASCFVCRELDDRLEITYEGARRFRVPLDAKPSQVSLSGYRLDEGEGRRDRWTYVDGVIRLDRFIRRYGQLDILTGGE